jgi:glycosyltransferase involved in cell wall biosynthesis
VLKIYDCVDFVASLDAKINNHWQKSEKRIIEHTDVCFANSKTLYKHLIKKHKEVYKVPVGFNAEILNSHTLTNNSVISNIPKPRILFVGRFNPRIDFALLYKLISSNLDCSFILIGLFDDKFPSPYNDSLSQSMCKLKHYNNVFVIDGLPKSHIGYFIKMCDAGLIPYDISDSFNTNSYPVKSLEYFYFDKPIISTQIKEMEKFESRVLIVNSNSKPNHLKEWLSKQKSDGNKHDLSQFTEKNTFYQKIQIIRNILVNKYKVII